MPSFIIRASSLGKLFDRPAFWAATHLEIKHVPSNSKAILGKAIDASTGRGYGIRKAWNLAKVTL